MIGHSSKSAHSASVVSSPLNEKRPLLLKAAAPLCRGAGLLPLIKSPLSAAHAMKNIAWAPIIQKHTQ